MLLIELLYHWLLTHLIRQAGHGLPVPALAEAAVSRPYPMAISARYRRIGWTRFNDPPKQPLKLR